MKTVIKYICISLFIVLQLKWGKLYGFRINQTFCIKLLKMKNKLFYMFTNIVVLDFCFLLDNLLEYIHGGILVFFPEKGKFW